MTTASKSQAAKSSHIPAFPVDDVAILRRKWHAALKPGSTTPPFEEVILGSLGRLADNLGLIHLIDGIPTLLHAGRYLQLWLGDEFQSSPISDLPPECCAAVTEAYRHAARLQEPYLATAYCVRHGSVESYNVFALPMSSRWGKSIVAIYVGEKGDRYNLVDTIFQSTDQGIVTMAVLRDENAHPVDFQIVDLNKGASNLLRLPPDELRWRRFSESRHALQSPEVMAHLLAVAQSGADSELEIALGDGMPHIKVGVKAIGGLLSATLTDVTKLKQREQSFRLLFDNNPMPMWVFDAETHHFLSVNDAAVLHYGYSRDVFLTMCVTDIWPEEERTAHTEALACVGDVYQSKCWRHIRADGSEIEVLSYGRKVSFDRQDAFLVALVDVTERRRAEAKIAHMAHHDALTGLPNRVQFNERLAAALAQPRGENDWLAVLCIDLDLFKNINDSFGHPMGDRLLQLVASRFSRHLRPGDLVARIGGDEFAVILDPAGDPMAAGLLASQIIKTLSAPYLVDDAELLIGASIGIALSPGDGTTAEDLIRNADMALYRAKTQLRGTHCFFEPEMDRHAQRRRTLETDLRRAFASGEFELHYQPLIDLSENRVVAFEALLRWMHPDNGLVSPADFIPVAEDMGLIVALGEWVLREACMQAAQWAGDVRIAVNLSPVQFRSRGLVQAVMTALARSGLSPNRLELEITETVLLAETDANLAILHQLRNLGVRISMDDFGTGYSSLGYLRAFPFDKIKIDRSFVRELAERPDCVAIVRAISGLGRSLGITTTAEGVETAEQLDCLRSEGCTEVQGFLFSAARPAAETADLIMRLSGLAAKAA